jgi:hypothetical protein
MKFKEWLVDEARFKGLQRQYQQQHRDKPPFVVNQMYKAMVYPNVRREMLPWMPLPRDPSGSTVAPIKTPPDPDGTAFSKQTPPDPDGTLLQTQQQAPQASGPMPNDLVSKALAQAETLEGVRFPRKPRRITINPSMLSSGTLLRLRYIRFGFMNVLASDERRHSTHRNLAASRGEGKNEPIILVREPDGKYDLIDGYHRISAYFQRSMPPEDAERVKAGDFSEVDFSKWRPITMNAYIGFAPATHPMIPSDSPFQGKPMPTGPIAPTIAAVHNHAAMNADSPKHRAG